MPSLVDPATGATAAIIQLAMAPAFLLLATGNILQLFAGRLARIVDRERQQMRRFDETVGEEHRMVVQELRDLDRRAGITNFAISMGIASAITVGLLIAMIFLMGLLRVDLSIPIAIGFILAMAFLIVGLSCFLIEVRFAARNIHVHESLLVLDEPE